MKQDNAIKKVLKRSDSKLSFDFENRTMQRIQKVYLRKKKNVFALQLFLVSVISVALILVVFYIVNTNLETDLGFGKLFSIIYKVSSYGFQLYIAFLALVLLSIDTFLRKICQAKNDKSIQIDGE